MFLPLPSSLSGRPSKQSFEKYIELLKEDFNNLVQYREKTGSVRSSMPLALIQKALEDDDPFVVFDASLLASELLADQSLYH
ncbi:MAG: hypothetical protein ACKOAD_05815 [Gammaproteobacteria bacterium]